MAWSAPRSSTTTYAIYRNDVQIASTSGYKLNFLDTGLSANRTYLYSVAATNNSGASARVGVVATTAASATTLTGCRSTPLASGHYVLSANVVKTGGGSTPCLTFENGSNVSLDCHGRTITSTSSAWGPLVRLSKVNGFLIYNCTFKHGYSNPTAYDPLSIIDSSNGAVDHSKFPGIAYDNIAYALRSSNLAWTANTFTDGGYQEYAGKDNYFGGNTVTKPVLKSWSSPVAVLHADGTVVADNPTLDGAATSSTRVGADDGIVIDGTNVTVARNKISNVWELGIEPADPLTDSTIEDNVISHAYGGGIGGWYGLDFRDNWVLNNHVDHSGPLLWFGTATGAQAFTGNIFMGNTLTAPADPSEPSIRIRLSSSTNPVTASGNAFVNNDLGKTNAPPIVQPASLLGYVSGNRCTLPSLDLPCT